MALLNEDDESARLLEVKHFKRYDSTPGINTSMHASSSSSMAQSVGAKHSVTFHDICYTVRVRKLLRKPTTLTILNQVSGIMNPGLNAIMGPSGGGKTTLLDVLADRKPKSGLSGHVLIDGKRQPKNFKCASAYVLQEDVLMGTLSVRENIAFSAALRLPRTMTARQRQDKVDDVIRELGLVLIADNKVGTEFIRGISGGQKKRTSIGMELIISPGIVFLDEPTTGLDATTAISVVTLLKELSNRGRVIIISIHQPRYAIYKLFDTLTLLSRGQMVYHGLAGDTPLEYFANIGYYCEEHNNPADFLLDVITENESKAIDLFTTDDKKRLADIYESSEEYYATKKELDVILERGIKEPQATNVQYNAVFLIQLYVVSMRAIKNTLRNPAASGVRIIKEILVGLLTGIIFLQVTNAYVGLQDRMGALFFMLVHVQFASLSAATLFIIERPVFLHQNTSGYYRVSTYFIAKVFCDMIPMRIIPALIFGTIAYWMIGLEPIFEKYLFFMFVMSLMTTVTVAQVLAVSAIAPLIALDILDFVFIFQLLTAGFLRNLNSLPNWLSWVQYFSIIRYALNSVAVSEIKGHIYSDFSNVNGSAAARNFSGNTADGTEYLESLGFLDYDVWFNVLALVVFIIFFLSLAYLFLRKIVRDVS